MSRCLEVKLHNNLRKFASVVNILQNKVNQNPKTRSEDIISD